MLMAQLFLTIPKKLTVIDTSKSLMFPKKERLHLDLCNGSIGVLCKLNNVHEDDFPLTKQNEQGYLYGSFPIMNRSNLNYGRKNEKATFTKITTKNDFLKMYPLKKITNE